MATFVRCARFAAVTGSSVLRQARIMPAFHRQAFRGLSLSTASLAEKRFTEGHEWVTLDGKIGTVGLSNHAQDSLGEIVFVELPEVDSEFQKDDECGVVESVKAVSEIFCPLSGKITEQNQTVVDEPSLINKSCYSDGWLFKIELSKESELDDLMDEAAYNAFLKSQE